MANNFKKALGRDSSLNQKTEINDTNNNATSSGEDTVGSPFGARFRQRMELERTAENQPIQEISLGLLLDNPFQHLARETIEVDEALEGLANSIRSVGFYGSLLARVKPGLPGYYELAFGQRRKRAAELVGLKTLPVKIVNLSTTDMLKVMAGENFSRLDLDPLNESLVVGALESSENLSVHQIAISIGQTDDWVAQRLVLYHAPQDVKELIKMRPKTLGQVQRLVTVKDAAKRATLIQEILEQGLTQKELNTRINNIKAMSEGLPSKKPTTAVVNVEPSQPLPDENHQNGFTNASTTSSELSTLTNYSSADQDESLGNRLAKTTKDPQSSTKTKTVAPDSVNSFLAQPENEPSEWQGLLTKLQLSVEEIERYSRNYSDAINSTELEFANTTLARLQLIIAQLNRA